MRTARTFALPLLLAATALAHDDRDEQEVVGPLRGKRPGGTSIARGHHAH